MTSTAAGTAQIGVTGLATMGRNLARNLARHGHVVAVHNRTQQRTEDLLAHYGDEGTFVRTESLQDLVDALERPRRVVIMVQAGAGTDAVIDALVPLLEPGDVVVDGGNAHVHDTRRREQALREHDLHFVGVGISGGEEGALLGPSIMPGGSAESYESLGPLLESIAADVDGEPCCTHVGPDGAGHFVKMVHNGIEYGVMQLIAEAYDLLRRGLGADNAEIGRIAADWNTGVLDSFLLEVTSTVLGHTDSRTGGSFVDIIRDAAAQKGTGRWTVQLALDLGVPVSVISEATLARSRSGHTDQRAALHERYLDGGAGWTVTDRDAFISDVHDGLLASVLMAYAEGFDLIRSASRHYEWDVDLAAMARIWRGGCIIRAGLLDTFRAAYAQAPDLEHLLAAPAVRELVEQALPGWRRVVAGAVANGVPASASAAALGSFDALRAERLPAALIQAQRDWFGAHTYQRVDTPGTFHVDWYGDGTEQQA